MPINQEAWTRFDRSNRLPRCVRIRKQSDKASRVHPPASLTIFSPYALRASPLAIAAGCPPAITVLSALAFYLVPSRGRTSPT